MRKVAVVIARILLITPTCMYGPTSVIAGGGEHPAPQDRPIVPDFQEQFFTALLECAAQDLDAEIMRDLHASDKEEKDLVIAALSLPAPPTSALTVDITLLRRGAPGNDIHTYCRKPPEADIGVSMTTVRCPELNADVAIVSFVPSTVDHVSVRKVFMTYTADRGWRQPIAGIEPGLHQQRKTVSSPPVDQK
jgi:hypothetical protein